MSKPIYRYAIEDDLYTIYSVNVTLTDLSNPTTENERSATFKFKQKSEALTFIDELWNDNYEDGGIFFKDSLVVRTNLMRSGKKLN